MNTNSFIQRALELGYSNLGNVSPNPSVGAVLVKDNKIIAEGVTQPPGGDHAEINAIKKCTRDQLKDSILYVTLEPCSHTNKRTPPCTLKLIESDIKHIIIGTTDKNPAVAHSGINALNSAGIKTTLLNDKSCEKLHEFFFQWITTKRPFVTIKAAVTPQGYITWGDGIKKKLTDETASTKVHELRKQHDAILVGINTILKDDPQLNIRLVNGRSPIKIILDSKLQTPIKSRVFNDGKTIIYCDETPDNNLKAKALSTKCEVVQINPTNLNDVLTDLGKRNITSVLVEGGAQIINSFITQKQANKCIFFIVDMQVENGYGLNNFKETLLNLKNRTTSRCGNALVVEGYL